MRRDFTQFQNWATAWRPTSFITGGNDRGRGVGSGVEFKGTHFSLSARDAHASEYDEHGTYLRSLGEGLFTHPHGLRVDEDDNLWTTDDGSHLVLKLSPAGGVLLVLGRKGVAAESDWLFNQPTDVAFGRNREIYVSDGYGNSRVVKFDRDGNFMKTWGKYGTGQGEFNLPHTSQSTGRAMFTLGTAKTSGSRYSIEGKFLKEWTGSGIRTVFSLRLINTYG